MDLSVLEKLALPKGEWCLVSGKCLELRGLRKSEDWDILVSRSFFEDLIQIYLYEYYLLRFAPLVSFRWNHLKTSYYKTPILVFDNEKIEIFKDLPFFEGQEEEIINQAELIDWLPCMEISTLIRFKTLMGRQKDFRDIELLQKIRNNA